MSNTTNTNNCKDLSDICPVEASIYGYFPSLGVNAFFAAFFGIFLVVQLFQGLKWKSRAFMIALVFGCLGEAIGYVGRILLHKNPFSVAGFNMQICCLIIAPAFLAAGIYLTLKHIVLTVGPEFSRLPATYYTWIFISCDLLSLILQGAGGGIAATADTNKSLQDTGNNLMMAGIVWQVFTLLVFGVLAALYAKSASQRRSEFNQSVINLLSNTRFKLFISSLVVAYLAIFTRCVYRIAEMAGGWRNSIMQDETDFIVLDGVMCLIATFCLTVFHPGYCFPQMQMLYKRTKDGDVVTSEKSSDMAAP